MIPASFLKTCRLAALTAGQLIAGAASAAVGDIDTTFSSDGVEKSLVAGYQGEWRQVLPLADRVVVAGTAYYHPELRFTVPVSGLLAAYTTAGALDTAWGTNGYFLRSGSGAQASAYHGVVRLSSGKFLAVGTQDTPAKALLVTRLNANGSVDTAFGTDGHVLSAAVTDPLAPRVAARTDGSFVIATPRVGTGTGAGTVRVLAFTSSGALDTGFDTDGIKELAFAGSQFTEQTSVGLAIQEDGKVLVGATESGGGGDVGVYRLNTNGSADTAFDNMLISQDGYAVYSLGNSQEVLSDIAVQPDGRIVIVGQYRPTAGASVPFQGLVIRAMSNGRWDETFNGGGSITTDFSGYDGEAFHRALVQSDGDILALGNAVVGTAYPQESRLLIARYNGSGTLDTGFGSSGATVLGPSLIGKCSQAFTAALGTDGSVYFAGESTASIWQNSACSEGNEFLLGRQVGAPLVEPADTTPDAFAFVDRTGLGRSSVAISAAVTISGIDAPAQLDVTGGQYSIGCTGSYTDATGTISNGQTLCARLITSASYSAVTSMVVTIGGVSDTFTATTMAEPAPGTDSMPDAFSFMDLTSMAIGVQVTSPAITVSGINVAVPVSVSGGEYSVGCSGTFSSTVGTVSNGSTVCVRHTTGSGCAATRNTVLTIGGVSDTFTSTTYDDSSDSDGDGVSDCSDSEPADATVAAVRTAAGQSLDISTDAGNLANVFWQDASGASNTTGLPTDRVLTYGLLGYRVTGLANGATAHVTLTYPTLPANVRLYKYTAAGFTDITTSANVAVSGGTVTLTLVDGGFGDADATANGVIVDPIAVATLRPAGGGGGCSLRSGQTNGIDPSLPVLAVFSALYLLLRRARAA